MPRSSNSRKTAQDMEPTTSTTEAQQDLEDSPSLQQHEEGHEQDHALDPLFQDVIFYLNPFLGGERIAELEATLCANGAQKAQTSIGKTNTTWTSDRSRPTHIITDDLDFPDYKHAKARAIHIVTPEWVDRSVKSGLQDPRYFSADPIMIFSGIVLTTTGLAPFDRKMICDGVRDYGGCFTSMMTSDVTHVIAITPTGEKYDFVMSRPELDIKVVLPHWFEQCINLKRRLPETIYQFPDLPMQNQDYVVSRQGYAPQLYVNSVKTVTMFLSSLTEDQPRCLEGLRIHMASDLNIVQDLKVAIDQKIEEAGGILVDQYTSGKVDVVVCRFRAGEVYIKASRDGKIVGSPDWLLHVLHTRELSSPKASLLHYPVPLEPIEGMSSFVITVTNYSGRIREYLKRLIQVTGATYTPTMSSRVGRQPTTHLICGNASGEKYEKGNEWNIKVVNHLWLEESFQAWSLQSETRPRFTVFPIHGQLSLVFGAKISPESLEEWINPDDQEPSRADSQAVTGTSSSESTMMDISPFKCQSNGQEPEQQVEHNSGDSNDIQGPEQEFDQAEEEHPGDTSMVMRSDSERSPSPPILSKGKSKRVSTIKQAESDTSTPTTGAPSPQAESSVGEPSVGSVRVVSRRRGAALQASKALQKIVPDMNEFQEELRDEKKALKRKKKPSAIEESKDSDSMDMDVDEEETKPAAKKPTTSPSKRKKADVEKSVAVGSDDDGAKEVETHRGGSSTPSKKQRRGVMLDKDKAGEDSAAESPNALDQAGAGAGTTGASSKQRRVRYITTGVKEQTASQIKALKALGIQSTTTVEKCTHLVATSITRTGKFLIALLQGKIIVREEWLQACIDANSILDEDDFRIEDPANEQKLDMKLYDSLERAREKRVFENCVFYLSPSMKQDMPLLKSVVEAGGGKAPTLLQTGLGFLKGRLLKADQWATIAASRITKDKVSGRRKDGRSGSDDNVSDSEDEKEIVAVVSSEKDKDMWQPILDAGAHVYSHDVISLGVLTQKLDLSKTHALA
ncbi:hypothetical protein BGX34_001874 [Mortierella sp. NVP85]|nr:hypothetical protein BGX34_001874 [Mortierella sp. NVP85]